MNTPNLPVVVAGSAAVAAARLTTPLRACCCWARQTRATRPAENNNTHTHAGAGAMPACSVLRLVPAPALPRRRRPLRFPPPPPPPPACRRAPAVGWDPLLGRSTAPSPPRGCGSGASTCFPRPQGWTLSPALLVGARKSTREPVRLLVKVTCCCMIPQTELRVRGGDRVSLLCSAWGVPGRPGAPSSHFRPLRPAQPPYPPRLIPARAVGTAIGCSRHTHFCIPHIFAKSALSAAQPAIVWQSYRRSLHGAHGPAAAIGTHNRGVAPQQASSS